MEYFGDIQSKRNVIICAANYNKLTSHFSRLSKTPKRLEASEGLERERGEFGGEREKDRYLHHHQGNTRVLFIKHSEPEKCPNGGFLHGPP